VILPEQRGRLASPGTVRIGLRVADLDAALARLEEAGVRAQRMPDEAYGRFGLLADPEGNDLELWEPPLVLDERAPDVQDVAP
jgi:predicted enzyme related to lactoylglutathione lyase